MKIKIPSTGQISELDLSSLPSQAEFLAGQELLVEADGIIEPAFVLCDTSCIKISADGKKVRVLRAFTVQDLISKKQLKAKAETFLEAARAKVFRHGLNMKILDADLSFDQKKLTFYFSAESRVDFRALVADMVGDMGKMIRLQQVGPREETKRFGGFGRCGRPLCCVTFLNNLDQVSADVAEVQDAGSLKSPKLAGCCGKPMCCLSYGSNEKPKVEVAK